MNVKGYIGSYNTQDSKSILAFAFDEETQEFLYVKEILPYADSKYLSLYKQDFVSLTKKDKAGIVLWRKAENRIETLYHEEITSCYVTQDDHFIYTANYHEGHVCIYRKDENISLYKTIAIQEKAGCHQVILYQHYLLVPCLLLDVIRIYDRDQDFRLVKELHFEKGSGPRHGIFDHSSHFFVLSELSCQLFQYRVNEDFSFVLERVVNLLEQPDKKASAAALKMSSDERFLYCTIRGINKLIVYDIAQHAIIQDLDCGGDHPRDMALTPDERFVFVVNRFTNDVCVFARQINGLLKPITAKMHSVEGVSIVFEKQEDNV